MRKLTKKSFLILTAIIMMISPILVKADYMVENNCQLTFNFLGIVKKWKGSKTFYNPDTNSTYTVGCGEDGGSWDWFWE